MPAARDGPTHGWNLKRAVRAIQAHGDVNKESANEDKDVLAMGKVTIESHKMGSTQVADFAVVRHKPNMENMEQLMKFLQKEWKLPAPDVLISVAGSAERLSMEQPLQETFKNGLASAARSTKAWVVTGGMDAGVMALTGAAMRTAIRRDGRSGTQCIGIVPFRKVTHCEKFYNESRQSGSSGRTSEREHIEGDDAAEASADGTAGTSMVHYVKRKNNSHDSAGIDANHTHFLMVDNQKDEDWGGEIELRTKLESELAKYYRVPLVLLVIEGGANTYKTVINALRRGHMVVLVKESKGAAQAIAEYIQPIASSRRRTAAERKAVQMELDFDRHTRDYRRLLRQLHPRMKDKDINHCLTYLLEIASEHLDLLLVYASSASHGAPSASFDIVLLKAFVESFKRTETERLRKVSARRSRAQLQGLKSETPHRNARGPHPGYMKRDGVDDKHVPWSEGYEDYNPSDFTAKVSPCFRCCYCAAIYRTICQYALRNATEHMLALPSSHFSTSWLPCMPAMLYFRLSSRRVDAMLT